MNIQTFASVIFYGFVWLACTQLKSNRDTILGIRDDYRRRFSVARQKHCERPEIKKNCRLLRATHNSAWITVECKKPAYQVPSLRYAVECDLLKLGKFKYTERLMIDL